MRKAKKSAGTCYIDSRIAQLESGRGLTTKSADIMWYKRIMLELGWARQAITRDYFAQCVLERTA